MTNGKDNMGRAEKDFLAEAEEIIDKLSLDLVGLSDGCESGECNPDLLNSIFRGAHSLKGLAGMFGFAPLAELAHNLENLLDSLRLGKVNLTPSILGVLFDSLDLLAALVRESASGGESAANVAPAIERINACITAKSPDEAESPLVRLRLPQKSLNALTEYEEHRLLENVRKGRNILSARASFSLETFDQELAEVTELLKSRGEVISTLPSAGTGLEHAIDFEILFGTEQDVAAVTLLVDRENVVITQLGGEKAVEEPTAATEAEAETETEAETTAEAAGDSLLTAKSFSRTVRVDIGKLDELMNIVGELVLSHSMIAEQANRMRRDGHFTLAGDLDKSAKVLERKLAELQKGVMDIRMIPVGQLFEKMARIVRKLSREQGKHVELKLVGADTELDKLIIEDISDPLMHLIRNAIDHGIESPLERIGAGKDERGTIRLSSFQKGNHVVIEVEDDGRGIDLAKVRRKALEKGLIKSMEAIPDREAMDLIFMPG
ncbi:MAG TPA: Hpt domain-containing protein, partial [Geobacteraceae bacterium]